MKKPFCIGHRGSRGYRPENTLASFDHALSVGCPWVELDVYAVEGELLVIHDKSVDRTTNGTGLIQEMTLQQLRTLDAGDGQQIPTLDEVVKLVDQRCGINVELKGPATAKPVNAALARYCESGWQTENFLISSFNHRELAKADSDYRRGVLFADLPADWLSQALALGAWSANFDYRSVTPELVNEAHEAGLNVLVYTANDQEDIRKMIIAGVDGIFSDYPDRVLALVDQIV